MIVAEGIRSSLRARSSPTACLWALWFFSSTQPKCFSEAHVETFSRIAGQLSVIVEKGRLVSELSEQKAAIERQNEELRRLNDLKNTFLSIAAHDLRNPIGAIQTSVDLLMDPALASLRWIARHCSSEWAGTLATCWLCSTICWR